MTCMVSVSDEADISRHHKSGGWARSGEVSHTGSSKINFLWPLNPPPGETKPLNWAAGEERQPPLTPRESPACESSPTNTHMLLHLSPLSWCDHLQNCGRAGSCQPHAARYAKVEAAILSQHWIHLYTSLHRFSNHRTTWRLRANGELGEEIDLLRLLACSFQQAAEIGPICLE